MTRPFFVALVLACVVGAPACLGTSPEEREREALGDYDDDDGDEFHRPGQPCLTCHREGYSPGDDVFQVAGTVYLTPTSPEGIGGVTVEVTDALGRVATVTTNRVGNFMFAAGDGDEDDGRGREGRNGKNELPYRLAYPLTTRIRYLEFEQVMESVTWREGSCAHCHQLEGPDGTAEGRVYVTETAP